MKLLVAIPSDDPANLATLKWAARAGFQLRIFVDPAADLEAYKGAVKNANYEDYLDLRHDMVVAKDDMIGYARKHGFNLLAIVPPNLKAWKGGKNHDKTVIEYATALASTRRRMRDDPKLQEVTFENGTKAVRL